MNKIRSQLARIFRHKWLLAGAGALIVGVSIYFLTDVRPRAAQLDKAQARLNELQRQIKQSQQPPETLLEIKRLESELAGRQRELEAEKQSAGGVGRFASVNGSAELQSLNLKLSELAAATNVQIRQRSSYVWPESNPNSNDKSSATPPKSHKATLASVQSDSSTVNESPTANETQVEQQLIRELYGESLQQFEIEATYAGLRDFIDGLDRLPRPVVIVKFEIHVDAGDRESRAETTLKSILVLAM